MKKATKGILVGACSFCLLLGGFVGGVYAKASERNYLTVNYGEKTTTAFQGQTVEVAKVTPVYPDKVEYVFYTLLAPDGTRVTVEDGDFEALQAGEYTVLISIVGKDGNTNVESYTVSVSKSAKPVATTLPVVPTAFIEGFSYTVPEAAFTDYNLSTPDEVAYAVALIDEDGAESVITGEFLPSVRLHENCVQLKYTATSSVTGQTEALIYSVPVLKAITEDEWGDKYYAFDKMFVTEGVTSSDLEETGALFYGENDFKISYANALNASLSVDFASVVGYDNFQSVVFTLTDYVDESVAVSVEIASLNAEQSRVTLNSAVSTTVRGSFKDYNSGFMLVYDNQSFEVANALGDAVGAFKTDLNGKPFKGFPSNLVRLTAEIKSVYGSSAIKIANINGQYMNATKNTDRIAPTLFLEKEMQVRYAFGETVTLPKAIGVDVVSPNVEVSVNVTAPDGNVVSSLNGVSLWEAEAGVENAFNAAQLGEYVVQYIAADESGNKFTATYYTVYVVDKIAPVLALKSTVKSDVTVGDELTIPEIEYSDDLTATEDLYVIITLNTPKGNFERLEVGSKFKFEIAGTYHLCFTVIDSFKNMTTVERIIVCK